MTSLVEERERGDPLLLMVCLLRDGMRGKGLPGLASGLSGEEEREKREGEKHRERFLASICRERERERVKVSREREDDLLWEIREHVTIM